MKRSPATNHMPSVADNVCQTSGDDNLALQPTDIELYTCRAQKLGHTGFIIKKE